MKHSDHSAGQSKPKQRFLWVDNQKIQVSEEVYQAYHTAKRRERYQRERDKLNGLWLYSTLDGEETSGEEAVYDSTELLIEELVVDKIMAEKLHSCIQKLTPAEQQLIHQLFFKGLTLREVAEKRYAHFMTIQAKKEAILCKLTKLFRAK